MELYDGYFLIVFVVVVTGEKALPESDRKNRQERRRIQCQPEMVGTFKVDALDASDINGRSTFGWRNGDPNAYCILSEAGKDSSTEID